jgi:hypothetical protein
MFDPRWDNDPRERDEGSRDLSRGSGGGSSDPRERDRPVALDLITTTPDCVLLWQVACEFIAASRKLDKQGFTSAQAWERLTEFRDFMPLVNPTAAILLRDPFA